VQVHPAALPLDLIDLAFAVWLTTVPGPAAFGADANTPLIDAIDFNQARTHWQTGDRKLMGAWGDDLLVGPTTFKDLKMRYDAGCTPTLRS
jgi:hypothetical protein